MKRNKGLVLFLIFVVLVVLFFNLKFLGFAVSNDTTSEVIVSPINVAPNILHLDEQIYACEGDNVFNLFNASDGDGDALEGRINPASIFSVLEYSQVIPNIYFFAIVSGKIGKSIFPSVNSGFVSYLADVIVDDNFNSSCCTDTEQTNITLIEINNIPVVEDIGVHTIWTQGDNSTFYEEWSVSDVEFRRGYGTLNYSLNITNSTGSLVDLFNISSVGVMDFTADNETPVGVYDVDVCVEDTGLTVVHPNITDFCSQDGGLFEVCDYFSLTVTDENRAPYFEDYYPGNLSFSSAGKNTIYFNITKHDPDGTIPDSYWYVDGVLKTTMSGSNVDEYRYSFGCGVTGAHNVSVVITDGLLNATLVWNVTVLYSSCVTPPSSSSGGGSSGGGPVPARKDFVINPEFITTTLFQEQGKTFDLVINNTGDADLNFEIESVNVSDMIILSEDEFSIKKGEGKNIRLYIYSLKDTEPGVYFGKLIINGGGLEKEVKLVIEIKKREPLFDVKVRVPEDSKFVLPGDKLPVDVDMLNVGMYGNAVDVELYLFITNLDKLLIYEAQKEMIAVETNVSVERELSIPLNTVPGTYLVMGEVVYGNTTINTFDTFTVGEKKYVKASYFLIISIILALIILILFIIYKRRKDKKERGYR